jgi:hypothetical protein
MVEQYGIVAILDALGVSNYKIDEASNFISEKNKLLSELAAEDSQLSSIFCKAAGDNPKIPYPKMTISTFGDSIIICWPIEGKVILETVFPVVAFWLQKSISQGIKHRILLRGSVSIGKYLVDNTTGNTTIIGPAIADANAWSQAADWFGIILTPYCQMRLTEMLENTECIVPIELLCVKYPVPLRQSHDTKELYAISWPIHFLIGRTKENSGLFELTSQLSELSVPKGVESKFENSINFFKVFEKEKYPIVVKYGEGVGKTSQKEVKNE